MTTLVLVTGPPGSGKTTLAVPLARRLELPLIAKDTIKEALFDALGTGPVRVGDVANWVQTQFEAHQPGHNSSPGQRRNATHPAATIPDTAREAALANRHTSPCAHVECERKRASRSKCP
jgi:predicted ATPase